MRALMFVGNAFFWDDGAVTVREAVDDRRARLIGAFKRVLQAV